MNTASDSTTTTHETPSGGSAPHVMSLRLLVMVWGALMVLTAVTLAAAKIDLGPRDNLFVAMGIATSKALLVALFFMHLLYEKKFLLLVFVTGLLFVFLFVGMTMLDSAAYQPDITSREQAQPAQPAP